jgi:uncharacterized protein
METPAKNPFTWVEIYVEDMPRAVKFYEAVLKVKLSEMPMPEGGDDFHMVSFPWAEGKSNISGALVKTSMMKPGTGGTVVYFTCDDCAEEVSRVEGAGGKVLKEKFSIGDYGFCGICIDSEGNTIGFHSMK